MVTAAFQPVGQVLRWARQSVGLTQEQAAKQLNLTAETLEAWESERSQPSFAYLKKLAAKYDRPIAALLLDHIPPEPALPEDFRTLAGVGPRLSVAGISNIRDINARQLHAADLMDFDPTLLPTPTLGLVTQGDNIEEVAFAERDKLNISAETQVNEWDTANDAFTAWRLGLERTGILVFARKVPRSDYRGFSFLTRGLPPVIFVNSGEMPQARTFTIIHELAHLLMRRGGLCQLVEGTQGRGVIESYCNRFTAAFLMPRQLLEDVLEVRLDMIRPRVWELADIRGFARRMKVSLPATLRRFRDLEIADRTWANGTLALVENQDWQASGGGGGNTTYAKRRLIELGTAYGSAVLGALDKGIISTLDASEMLATRPVHFNAMRALL